MCLRADKMNFYRCVLCVWCGELVVKKSEVFGRFCTAGGQDITKAHNVYYV